MKQGILPPYVLVGPDCGPVTAIVTAGMDGDEEAGIIAAHALIDRWRKQPPGIRIAVMPCVNVHGRDAGISANPEDGLLPKRVYPGNPNGSSTARLIWTIRKHLLSDARIWIDLHGGARDETLVPFVGAWETGNPAVDGLAIRMLHAMRAPVAVYEERADRRIRAMAADKIAYLILESGHGNDRSVSAAKRHVSWVSRAVDAYQKSFAATPAITAYRQIAEYRAPGDGVFVPAVSAGTLVRAGDMIGEFSASGRVMPVSAGSAGKILWQGMERYSQAGETVVGIGSRLETVR